MPTLKTRVIRRESGEVVVKTTSVFSPEEAANLSRISDDPNVTFDTLRAKDYDIVLAYLRTLHFWGDIWNNRKTHSRMIMESVERRKTTIKRMGAKNKRRRK